MTYSGSIINTHLQKTSFKNFIAGKNNQHGERKTKDATVEPLEHNLLFLPNRFYLQARTIGKKFLPKPVLHGCLSSPKFMPYRFLTSSVWQRLFLKKSLPQAFSIVENTQQLEAIYVLFASICFCFYLLLFATLCCF
jgi:hypothetical protein